MGLGNLLNGDEASGGALVSQLANLKDGQRFRNIIDLANRRNVTFYPIDPEGLEELARPPAASL